MQPRPQLPSLSSQAVSTETIASVDVSESLPIAAGGDPSSIDDALHEATVSQVLTPLVDEPMPETMTAVISTVPAAVVARLQDIPITDPLVVRSEKPVLVKCLELCGGTCGLSFNWQLWEQQSSRWIRATVHTKHRFQCLHGTFPLQMVSNFVSK